MVRTCIAIIALLVILVGAVLLQIFLSKRRNKWLGLLLPCICFGYSLLMVFAMVAYAAMSVRQILTLFVSTFLIANIPTAILMVIYFACREKFKSDKEIEKMNIQDL